MMHVLVVEDERWMRQNICKMIEQVAGYQVIAEAKNGKEALELLEQFSPQVMLTDIQMPIMNGLQLVVEARRLLPKLEIVLFSGFNEFDYVREGLRYGVHDYLLKPVQAEELERVMQQIGKKIEQHKDANFSKVFIQMEFLRGRVKQLADSIWLAHKQKFEEDWTSLSTEWLTVEFRVEDVQDFFHLLIFMIDENIQGNYDAQLPRQQIQPIEFTGNVLQDMDNIREYLLTIMSEVMIHRNWRKNHIVMKALNYIDTHYVNSHMSLLEASKAIGLSPPYLSRIFKEEMEQSFVEYVTELRMKKAREMLGDPAAKVFEVAEAVGYTDYGYFVRVFKRVVGHSPSDYRKQQGIR